MAPKLGRRIWLPSWDAVSDSIRLLKSLNYSRCERLRNAVELNLTKWNGKLTFENGFFKVKKCSFSIYGNDPWDSAQFKRYGTIKFHFKPGN